MKDSLEAWALATHPERLLKSFACATPEQFDEFLLAVMHMAISFADHEASVSLTERPAVLMVDVLVYTTESAKTICCKIDKIHDRITHAEHHRFSWLPHFNK